MRSTVGQIFFALAVIIVVCLAVTATSVVLYRNTVIMDPPVPENTEASNLQRTFVDTNFYTCNNSWLRKNSSGLWEMYLEGDPYEIGMVNGLLSKELIEKQERAFVNEIKKSFPSEFAFSFMRYFVAWMNRDLDRYFEKEQLLEICGISKSASPDYDYIGPAYQRMLNYHAAHDIAYSLQSLMLSECTSFAAWNSSSADSTLIMGRNFDFYAGDEFAEDKIVCFYKPEEGHKFMFVTWGGMIGAVSGMNDKGLAVTLNSAKAEVSFGARTPVSILAREILQYAGNINQAYKIAAAHETSVAVSFLVSSAADKRAVVIEKAGTLTDTVSATHEKIICTNHFRSPSFSDDPLNNAFAKNSNSEYRLERTDELLDKYVALDITEAAGILRDTRGLGEKNIGLGNEKAINQLIAHHSVIFEPSRLLAWVSSGPYSDGAFVCYDLNKVFSECAGMKQNVEIAVDSLLIPADTLLGSKEYADFLKFKKLEEVILNELENGTAEEYQVEQLLVLNPEFYYVYKLAGEYYMQNNQYDKAIEYFEQALSKEIPDLGKENEIKDLIKECNENH